MKKLRVTVEGKAYEVLVDILDEGTAPTAPVSRASAPTRAASTVEAPVSSPAASAPRAPSGTTGASGDITSPLTGKLISVDVTVGQSVEKDTKLATVEAMKMNTYIFASKAGRVTAVLAHAGDGVDEGTVILRIE